jgi:hypothetical protein
MRKKSRSPYQKGKAEDSKDIFKVAELFVRL